MKSKIKTIALSGMFFSALILQVGCSSQRMEQNVEEVAYKKEIEARLTAVENATGRAQSSAHEAYKKADAIEESFNRMKELKSK